MMEKSNWGTILLAEIFFLIFLTGFFPPTANRIIFPILYSVLYLTAAAGIDGNKKTLLLAAGGLLIAQVVFKFFNMPVVEAISKALNFVFFSYIVISLIRQIASAQHVTKHVILEAVNGYLLLGLVFTFLIGLMIQFDTQLL